MALKLEKELKTRVIRASGETEPWQAHETNSIVQPFPNGLANQLANNLNSPTVEDVGGASHELAASSSNFATANSTDVGGPGVVFGNGGSAVKFDDNDLGSRFTSGVSYNNGSVNIAQTASQTDIEVVRTMSNDSGGELKASEAGIIANFATSGSGPQQFLAVRDLIGEQTLEDGDSIIGTYTFIFDI